MSGSHSSLTRDPQRRWPGWDGPWGRAGGGKDHLLFNNKFDLIAATDNPLKAWDPKPGGASEGDPFREPLHIEELGVGFEHRIRHLHSLREAQSLS